MHNHKSKFSSRLFDKLNAFLTCTCFWFPNWGRCEQLWVQLLRDIDVLVIFSQLWLCTTNDHQFFFSFSSMFRYGFQSTFFFQLIGATLQQFFSKNIFSQNLDTTFSTSTHHPHKRNIVWFHTFLLHLSKQFQCPLPLFTFHMSQYHGSPSDFILR